MYDLFGSGYPQKMTRNYHFQNKTAYLLSKIDFLAIFIACFASVETQRQKNRLSVE